MKLKLRWIGNSQGVLIPKPILDQFVLTVGDEIEVLLELEKEND